MRTAALLVFASLALVAPAHAKPAALSFSEHGFSIEPPVGHDAAQMQQVVSLAIPMSDGFAPNVNVQVQPFTGPMGDFVKLSLDQFKAAGVKLVVEKHDARSAVLEYTGQLQGRALHWYARAFVGKNGIGLATATSLESQWAATNAALRQSVDSLRPLP